ncbi:hypothetical protein N8220_00420 [Schleiferiaceae bacterium]|nr:hypothetical protein [Schleiferiaceae bacterium]
MKLSETRYIDDRSLPQKLFLIYWRILWILLKRVLPLRVGFLWRICLVKVHGGVIGWNSRIYGSVKIYDPRNLSIGDFVTVGPHVNLYSVQKIVIGNGTVVSQKSELLTASHDFKSDSFDLVKKSITIGDDVWLSQGVWVGPGVKIANKTTVGARGLVVKSILVSGVYVAPTVDRLG